jgi:GT2 family glycosyltransferase
MAARISAIIPCFRDSERATGLAEALAQQELPPDTLLDIVVVDDGSGGHHPEALRACARDRYRVLALRENVGRSAARNAGARSCSADFLFFVDADCLPLDSKLLASHLEMLSSECIASTGHVCGESTDFWSRYQYSASVRRAVAFRRGIHCVGSSTNLAVQMRAFLDIGGFDERYGRYGFEDRDLLIRLARLGRVGWTEAAWVVHRDQLSMEKVFGKLLEAGRYSSPRFAKDHPVEYRQLGYGLIDVRGSRTLATLLRLLGPLAARAARGLDGVLDRPALPLWMKMALVRGLSAFAYAFGTALAERDARRPGN